MEKQGYFYTVGGSAVLLWRVHIATYTNNHGNTICNKKDKRKHPVAISAEDWLKIMV